MVNCLLKIDHRVSLIKIEIWMTYALIHTIHSMWLIPDLLNVLFDQSHYHDLVLMRSLSKRRTKYANKYSVLSYYDGADTSLTNACKRGLLKVVQCVDVDMTSLLIIIFGGLNYDLETVKYLVNSGVDVNACGGYALRRSTRTSNLNIVKYLVGVGANVRMVDLYALGMSAGNDHLEVVKYLIGVGANVHANDDLALIWSAKNGHLEVVEYLVSVGANIHVNDDELFELDMIKDNFSHLKNT